MCLESKDEQGFTLIELMIVVAILGILAAIAIPNFNAYQMKSKQSEAKVGLGAIFTAAVAYQAESQNPQSYAPYTVTQLGWRVSGSPRYSFWYQDGADAAGSGTVPSTFTGSSIATSSGFTAGANGNIDVDATCDQWFINDRRSLQNPTNDVAL
jgi:type IV pilus assembly protein PilA